MRRGRKIDWNIVSMGQAIFLLTVEDEYRASTLLEEQELSMLLEETGAGRLTIDPYELQEAHKMLSKRPEHTQTVSFSLVLSHIRSARAFFAESYCATRSTGALFSRE
jgi:hypothetical protein